MRVNTNRYEFYEDCVVIVTKRGDEILISPEDFETVKRHCWSVDSKGYANAGGNGLKRTTRLHRLILNCPKGMVVDHVNRNKLDNRRENLRVATPSQNSRNHGLFKNNASGYNNVYFNRECKKWCGQIHRNGKTISLGLFRTKEEAAAAVKAAENK